MQREGGVPQKSGGDVSKEEILEALSAGYPEAKPKREIERVLGDLIKENEHIESAILASTEGLPVAWSTGEGEDIGEEGKIAAAVSVIFSTSERNALDLEKGHVNNIIIKGREGYVFLRLVGEDHVLASVTSKRARPAVVIRDMSTIAGKLDQALEQF